MNETDFQAIFAEYQEANRKNRDQPVPQKLHLMVYNYAQIRHQQSSDVSADFYLHVAGKLTGILDRYDARRLPFYQYFAATLNFEFSHFLRRRKMPRSQIELLSLEELSARRVELSGGKNDETHALDAVFQKLKPATRIYAKLALAYPLSFGDLRLLAKQKNGDARRAWDMLRAYREFLRFSEEKRRQMIAERERLVALLMRLAHEIRTASGKSLQKLKERNYSAQKKFFSIDTRIPIRIVAAVTGDSIATAQRQLKTALTALKTVYLQWENQ
ncbi:MAG: hypothetical protein JSR44_03275 [Spirochaetes bacterium]|nr:hypothetical protein [Spirochaetota bacterium]